MTSDDRPAGTSDPTTPAAEVPADAVAVATDGAYYLIVAQFSDTAAAGEAYDALRQLESTSTLKISGVVVAHRDAKGDVSLEQMTEHSTRNGLGWGVVGGIVVGVLFPPSIIAGAIGAGAIGAAAGKLRNMHHKSEFARELEDALEPGTSGIVALVEDQAVVEVRRKLAGADRIVSRSVDSALAMRVEAEAAAAKGAEGAAAFDPDTARDLSRLSHA
jgi:uncharacterized membrane protein